MWDYGYFINRANASKIRKKLRTAWMNYYAPFQLSQSKLTAKVLMRINKGKFPLTPPTNKK